MKFKSGILFDIHVITNFTGLDNALRPLFYSGDWGLNFEVCPKSQKCNDSKFVNLANFYFAIFIVNSVLLDESKMKTIFAMSFHFHWLFLLVA